MLTNVDVCGRFLKNVKLSTLGRFPNINQYQIYKINEIVAILLLPVNRPFVFQVALLFGVIIKEHPDKNGKGYFLSQ
jgi:hypothetical protein